jgi:cold shock CspA family protein/ribosome-associated translation inhibitor RaiA
MQVPLKMTFRNVPKSPAIEALIRRQAAKLEKVCPHLVSCRVSVEKPQSHQKSGNPYRVRLNVTVPPEHEVVTRRDAGEGDLHQRLPTVLRQAFDAAQRQLKKLVDKQRGQTKVHPAQSVAGLVSRLFHEEGYGFIKTLEGREIYFHKNSVAAGEFDSLEIGTGVQWNEEQGENGPQATTVRIVDKPGARISNPREDPLESIAKPEKSVRKQKKGW